VLTKRELQKAMDDAFGLFEVIAHEADTSFLATLPLSVTEARFYNILRVYGAVLDELVKALPDEKSI
jgi:hypothetical protein